MIRYSSEFCYKMCYQEIVINTCNCYDLEIPRIRNASVCFTDRELDCQLYVNTLFSTIKIDRLCNHSCPTECTSVRYDLSDHKSAFPTDFYFTQMILRNQKRPFISDFTKQLYDLFNQNNKNDAFAKLKSKMLKVIVNYEDLRYVLIQDQKAMAFDTLLGILGGQVGEINQINFIMSIDYVTCYGCAYFLARSIYRNQFPQFC